MTAGGRVPEAGWPWLSTPGAYPGVWQEFYKNHTGSAHFQSLPETQQIGIWHGFLNGWLATLK